MRRSAPTKVVTGYVRWLWYGISIEGGFERGFKPEELVSYELGLKLEIGESPAVQHRNIHYEV
jgi:hypothetical protein